jgi:hypothetical protein
MRGPVRNSEITASSKETRKQSAQVATMPGAIMGRVTRLNTVTGEAPRVEAASSTMIGRPASDVVRTLRAYGSAIIRCAITSPVKVPRSPWAANRMRIARPSTMVGRRRGAVNRFRKNSAPRAFRRTMA